MIRRPHPDAARIAAQGLCTQLTTPSGADHPRAKVRQVRAQWDGDGGMRCELTAYVKSLHDCDALGKFESEYGLGPDVPGYNVWVSESGGITR